MGFWGFGDMNRNNLYDSRDLLNVYTKKLVDIVSGIGETREQVRAERDK